ncbi:hypothetical protein DEJ48_00715 [Streptomyces venezuelae]|uniref:Uncharacterized protein n=1 Tax=Streptomyces venezuelae TaxID=54571 RepID=A0A5P2BQB1_STRVZ|nr:hypothetical protein DEJ48_00715 [Streptomyces venezuelae]
MGPLTPGPPPPAGARRPPANRPAPTAPAPDRAPRPWRALGQGRRHLVHSVAVDRGCTERRRREKCPRRGLPGRRHHRLRARKLPWEKGEPQRREIGLALEGWRDVMLNLPPW